MGVGGSSSQFFNYMQDSFRVRKTKLIAGVGKYRLISCLVLAIVVDHEMDRKVERDLQEVTRVSRALQQDWTKKILQDEIE
mmetsp:Transcript_4072/g.4985  ORF Transcript_4072/g.4985 Transcript_4072/m.4985 type:complete len:81 (-) Transcript_4072:19-261(-)